MNPSSNKRMTIQDLNAYATAYGRPIGRKEYLSNMVAPGFILAVLGMLTMKWYVSFALFIVGYIYGRRVLLPNAIHRSYYLASMNERGRYMNVTSQIASNEDKSMIQVLRDSANRLNQEGELYQELTRLNSLIGMTDINPVSIRPLFQKLITKYKDDINFSLFLEQLETGLLNGNNQASTLVEIERHHTETRVATETFLKMKSQRLNDLKMSVAASWLIVGVFIMTIGISEYTRLMDKYIIGQICNGLFILANLLMFNRFNRFYWDDDITSIGDPKGKARKREEKAQKAKEKRDQKSMAKASKNALKNHKKKGQNKAVANLASNVDKISESKKTVKKQETKNVSANNKVRTEQKQTVNQQNVQIPKAKKSGLKKVVKR